jgi:membrane protein DedA with SNARE-associated domain
LKSILGVFTAHPYLILLLAGLLERIGLPLLFAPILVAAGALAAAGQMEFDLGLWLALVACIFGDALWYEVGRTRGDSVLSLLCRISLEPESCVRRSRALFEKGTNRTLLLAKWIPGLSHIVPAVAGLSGVQRQRFFLINTAGSALWIFAMMLAGYLPVERVHVARAIAPIAFEASLMLVAGNVALKYLQKRRFLKQLNQARIAPEELRQMLEREQSVVILDLRHPLDSVTDQRTLPGAIRVLPDDLVQRADILPKDREIVLYCT